MLRTRIRLPCPPAARGRNSGNVSGSANSRYTSSCTSTTRSGSAASRRCIAARENSAPVGLFGLHRNTMRVRSPIRSRMAPAVSCRPGIGTSTTVAPLVSAAMRYMSKVILRHQHLVAGAQKRQRRGQQNGVAAVAGNHAFGRHAVRRRNCFLEHRVDHFRVLVPALEAGRHGGHRLGAGAERILVGGELDDVVGAEFARHFGYGAARHVRRDVGDPRGGVARCVERHASDPGLRGRIAPRALVDGRRNRIYIRRNE